MKFEVKFILECPETFKDRFEEAVKNNSSLPLEIVQGLWVGMMKAKLLEPKEDVSVTYFRAGAPTDFPPTNDSKSKSSDSFIYRKLLILKSFFSMKKSQR
jgi:hypothetical protein